MQQLSCAYIRNGYYHYVVGEMPEKKSPPDIDRRLIERYGIDISRSARARRKRAGFANVHYLRFRGFFVLLATKGEHEFFSAHGDQVRDVRETPISVGGYSVGYHRGVDGRFHVSVRIHPERYRDLKARFLDMAAARTAEELGAEFGRVRFEPYAPVRRQLLNIHRAVNRVRKVAGMVPVPLSVLRLRRRIVRPFRDSGEGAGSLEEAA